MCVFYQTLFENKPNIMYKFSTFRNKLSRKNTAFKHLHWLLAFSFVFLASSADAQWTNQSPVPTFLDVRGIACPTADRVFIATDDNSFDDGGALFESNDAGLTWVQQNIPVSLGSPLNGIYFHDTQNGWAYGNENYRTNDGGNTWTELPFLGSTYGLEFYTPTLGIATGNFGQYITYDGGDNWIPSPNGIFHIDMSDALIGLGVSGTGIYRTVDGGNTFTEVYNGESFSAKFLSAGIAVGIAENTFVRSTDGGLTWATGTSAQGRTSLVVVTDNIIVAWGRSGNWPDYDDRIFRSSDGGQTWTDLGEIIPAGVFALKHVNDQMLVVADMVGNMYYSSNGGLNWNISFETRGQQPSYLSSSVPVFANNLTGYFGYGAGFIIKTTDGGVSWSQISSGTGVSLNAIDRFSNGNMIAVGENGMILRSNGTTPWIIDEAFTTLDLTALHVLSATEAVILDEEGRIYLTTNGGDSWTASTAKPSDLSNASDLHFTTSLDGWVVGQGYTTSAVYHTTDGGVSWTPVPEIQGSWVAIDVIGSNIWVANSGSVFYRSVDGGVTWIDEELPWSPLNVTDMDFVTSSTGYAVSHWGFAFKSTNGGVDWETLTLPPGDYDITDIYLLSENEFWLSTNNNAVLYTASGGQTWSLLEPQSEGWGSFSAISANAAGDAWIVGYQGYIEHFVGPPTPPLNLPPTAAFNFGTSGLTVVFTDESFDTDGFIVSWEWDFGDGSFSTDQNPTHTFAASGTNIVELTVTDDDGDTGNAVMFVVVQPNPGGTFGNFTEVTPIDTMFVTPQDEDFWVITTAPADFDNDGDLDIAVLGYYVVYNQSVEDRLVMLRNNGSANDTTWQFEYIDVPLGDISTGQSDLAWGDLDGDGDQDLVVASDFTTVIYRNDDGTLNLIDTNLPAYYEDNSQAYFDLRSVTWADYDNDGDADLLIPSAINDTAFFYYTALMRNDGANGANGWIFTQIDTLFAPTSHGHSAWADYDNDQDLDLLLVNEAPLTDDSFITRYRNDGNGVFTGQDILGNIAVEHGEVQWGDYDGDGDLDILIAGDVREVDGSYTPMTLRIYRNNQEQYEMIDLFPMLSGEGWFDITAAAWADYDSDGDIDILLAGNYNSGSQIEGRARIYINTNGEFAPSGNELPAPRASGDRGGTFSWLDMDNDGDLDYFIAGQYFVPGGNGLVEAQMHVYRNDAPGINSAPDPPTGLEETLLRDGSVSLTWLASSDDNTPSTALTYDLEVFHNNVPVLLQARLPAPGIVSAVTQWVLTGLPDGNYEWAVRAVDAAYIGSDAATGAFTIGDPINVNEAEISDNVFSLKQNSPNPVANETDIMFSIPETIHVVVKLYNLLGTEIRTLTNREYSVGTHSIKVKASGLSSGVYFYRLTAGNYSAVKKMTIK